MNKSWAIFLGKNKFKKEKEKEKRVVEGVAASRRSRCGARGGGGRTDGRTDGVWGWGLGSELSRSRPGLREDQEEVKRRSREEVEAGDAAGVGGWGDRPGAAESPQGAVGVAPRVRAGFRGEICGGIRGGCGVAAGGAEGAGCGAVRAGELDAAAGRRICFGGARTHGREAGGRGSVPRGKA